jgi:carboxymethylenebutenolidase
MNGKPETGPDAANGINELSFFPKCGSGPGLLLLADGNVPETSVLARARLFSEEGYVVHTLLTAPGASDIGSAATQLSDRSEITGGLVCVAHGDAVLAGLEAADRFDAIVGFDATPEISKDINLANLPCPIVFQFGTLNAPESAATAEKLSGNLDSLNGDRVYAWPEAAPGFSLPGHAAFDSRVDSLAHSRTLEIIRRVVGPHYDYVALFAEHIRHEFNTRDVDSTMATMIDAPYVNHVATLAGGVGHDMLKRFYKYHFVEQNSRDRSSVTVSHTLGPDRLVLELVVRFKHDQVLDRYFPNIEPTGEYAELATVLIVKFRGDKVCHEHIYWDQGSALKQIGVLDTGDLPVAGAEAARKVLDERLPSNIFMQNAWSTSDGKPI